MEQVTLNKETYDRLMDIEMNKDQEIDKLNDIIKELERGCIRVSFERRSWFSELIAMTNDEKTKVVIETAKDEYKDKTIRSKQDHSSRVEKIYNRNILQRIFNKRV